jgi:methionyl-tRNA formyltransferase
LRIVFFGTPDVAVPTLERLIAGPHDIVGVVSQPDRKRGRGKKLSPSPVSEVALREGLPLLRPERVGDPESIEALAALSPDLGVVVAFGQFLPKKVRELPSRGYLINAHASLLPKYRGASPIAQAILEGESETGISVMRIEREMDAGPVALVESTPIGVRENTQELTLRLSEIAADAIAETVDQIARDEVVWTEQDADHATVAPKIEKADGVLDLRESARALACRIHALAPRPGASLLLVGNEVAEDASAGAGETLKILRADVQAFETGESAPAGSLERDSGGIPLRVATGDGWLVPLTVQRAGGKSLDVSDFLRGYSLATDARFAIRSSPESESTESNPHSSEKR